MNRLRIFTPALMLAAAIGLGACSDDPVSNDESSVTFQAAMTTPVVNRVFSKGKAAAVLGGAEADSLMVSRVRILVKELKLHPDKSDAGSGDKVAKIGPIVIDATADTVKTFTTGTIAAGDYDKLKFEFHRFSSSEVPQYLDDPIFADFATDDRYSFIIEGTVYNGDDSFPFTYRSDVTANLSLKFEPSLPIEEGSTVVVVVEVDPVEVFKDKQGALLDPRDGKNEPHIDNAIKDAVRALKK